ncbi:LacI family DNA-binding transcriptional regulator [Paenibacillus sabuli]|uniref:LacI family DNA-binding transcriptional regulator n=1 Tax=Paenibacillus sabuli TaxID=2772509 RepID=UPI00295B8570|nr:LacI family DNA-binding transcriptional regulator [Paenibacillus sabuli]
MKIEDIAKMANVSKSAVSLAMNGKPGIGKETRARILQIAKEHGYAARTPKAEKGRAPGNTIRFIACTQAGIVPEHFSQQPFFMELIQYIEEKCRKRGLSLLFNTLHPDELERRIGELEQEHASAGILLLGTNLGGDQVRAIAAQQRRLVVLDTCFDAIEANFVVMNNKLGAHQAAGQLLADGHTRIGIVQSDERIANFSARQEGFLQALAAAGLDCAEEDRFTLSPTIVAAQEPFIAALRTRREPLPTALFCECDYIAISAIKSLAALGLRVPHDVSVIGFDNIHESVVITPELTTVHVEKEAMAELAVAKLIDLMAHGPGVTTKIVVDTRLVVRASCSAPAAALPAGGSGTVSAH